MADDVRDALQPLDMLARLAAQQDGRHNEKAIPNGFGRFDRETGKSAGSCRW